MTTLYCSLGGSLKDTLHLEYLPATGRTTFEAQSPADVQQIIRMTGATQVMFGGTWLPQRAVAVDHPQFVKHLAKAFNPPKPRQPKPVQVADDGFDPMSVIDF